jgi:hypothetical protein
MDDTNYAIPTKNHCPATHPVAIPGISLNIGYKVNTATDKITLLKLST